jgi:phosphatidylinositol glycan class Z
MGMPAQHMLANVTAVLPPCRTRKPPKIDEDRGDVYLVAPRSAYALKPFQDPANRSDIELEEVWSYRQHLNLDDMDFGDDGVWPTLSRVVGDRGLVIWRVTRNCWASAPA